MLETRVKWMKASWEVSGSKESSKWRRARGLWRAFWLAPRLEEHSSVEEFKEIYEE